MRDRLKQLWDDLRRHDSHIWRRAVDAGVTHGPDALVRYSPPLFGVAFAAALPRQRRAVRDNLRRALGPRSPFREMRDVAAVFANYASSLTDTFVAGSDRGDPLRVHCPDEGPLEDALRDGHGMILATAHTGGWQVAGVELQSLHGVDLVIVMRAERDAAAQQITDEKRARAGIKIAHLGEDPRHPPRSSATCAGAAPLAMQMDRLPQGMRGRKSELFGAPFLRPRGPLRLAAASGAPIVPVFTRRLGYMEYDVRVATPVRLPRRPDPDDLDRAARAVLRAMGRVRAREPHAVVPLRVKRTRAWLVSSSDSPRPQGDLAKYATRFDMAEVRPVDTPIPKASTLRKWRKSVPPSFVFSVVLPRVVGDLTPGDALDQALTASLEVAAALEARCVVLATPPEVRPTATNKKRIAAIFDRIPADGTVRCWEPAGIWEREEAIAHARAMAVIPVFDAARRRSARARSRTRASALGKSAVLGQTTIDRIAERPAAGASRSSWSRARAKRSG